MATVSFQGVASAAGRASTKRVPVQRPLITLVAFAPASAEATVATLRRQRRYAGVASVSASAGATLATVGGATVPDAPVITSSSIGDQSLTINFTTPADHGSAIGVYAIYESGVAADLVGPAANTYTNTQVTNGQTYLISIAAHNAAGWGPQSNVVSLIPAGLPFAPVVTGTPGNNTVGLSWPAVNNNGRAVTNHKIYRNVSPAAPTTLLTTQANVTSYNDNSAVNGTTYNYAVSAVTSIGEGAKSATVTVTPALQGAPGAPVLTGTAALAASNLSWTVPSGSPTSYNVFRNSILLGQPSPPNNTSFIDTNVVTGTQYSYTVVAINANGTGPASNAVLVTPFAAQPGAPVLSGSAGSNVVDLTWTVPAANGATITNYKVCRAVAPTVPTVLLATKTGSPPPPNHSDTTAVNGTSYNYRVTATNSVGEGAFSNTVTMNPQAAGSMPALPADVTQSTVPTRIISSPNLSVVYMSDTEIQQKVTARHWTGIVLGGGFLPGGYGAANRMTGDYTATFNAADGRSGGVWNGQRDYVSTNIIARLRAIGVEGYHQVRCNSYYAGGVHQINEPPPFVNPWDDAEWTRYTNLAGSDGDGGGLGQVMQALGWMGFKGTYDDWENYGISRPSDGAFRQTSHLRTVAKDTLHVSTGNPNVPSAWHGDLFTARFTDQQIKDKITQRGEEWKDCYLDAWDLGRPHCADVPSRTDKAKHMFYEDSGFGHMWRSFLFVKDNPDPNFPSGWDEWYMPWFKGVLNDTRWQFVMCTDSMYYRGVQSNFSPQTLGMGNKECMQYSSNSMMAFASQEFGTAVWDISADKWGWWNMNWIDQPQNFGEMSGNLNKFGMAEGQYLSLNTNSAIYASGPSDIAGMVYGHHLAEINIGTDCYGLNDNPSGGGQTQRIAINGAPTSGTFTLVYNGTPTAALPYNATAAQVQSALVAIGANVTVIKPIVGVVAADNTYLIATFSASQPTMTASDTFPGSASVTVGAMAFTNSQRSTMNWPTQADLRLTPYLNWADEMQTIVNGVTSPGNGQAPVIDSLTATRSGSNITISGTCHDLVGVSRILWQKRNGATILSQGHCTHFNAWYYQARTSSATPPGYDNEQMTFNRTIPGAAGDWFIVGVVSHDKRIKYGRVQSP